MICTGSYAFIHVPKTGGMAVTQALGGKSPGYATHTPLHCITMGERFAFGFIRNPWARLVSLYRFMCQKTLRETDNFDQDAVREMGFRRWLMDDRFYMQEDAEWMTSDLPPMQRRPQMWWLRGCDFIGRFENLTDDFRRACRLIDMTPPRLNHVNVTKGGDWRAEYDMPARRFVEQHFAADIEFGGYRFGP